MRLVAERADAFEEASIDEAYLDLSSLVDFEQAVAHVRAVKALILEREGLTCSVGLAPNKLVAKIASDVRKPDGLTIVTPEAVQGFLDPMSIWVIPGIGPKTEASLRSRGIRSIAELRAIEPLQLVEWLGKWGHDLYDRARGVSLSPVSNEWERKSVGEQETFEHDTLDRSFVVGRARTLAGGVFERLQGEGFRGFRTVTVTVRFENFVTLSRSLTAERVLVTREVLEETAKTLLAPFFDERENPRGRRIRLIGVRVEKLERESQTAGAGT
jgi:DNA polymerase IV (DinB-like DNA polymerase)